jgi:hypothetical protein
MRNRAFLKQHARSLRCLVAQRLAQKESTELLHGRAPLLHFFFRSSEPLLSSGVKAICLRCLLQYRVRAESDGNACIGEIVSRSDLPYAILLVALIASCASAQAQEIGLPSQGGMEFGGAGGLKAPTHLSMPIGENAGSRRHLGPTGQACLAVRGEARAETINPKLFEHVILATNECSQRIKADVCYYLSDHCVSLDVPSYGRDEKILGIMPSMTGFRFEYREQFSGL